MLKRIYLILYILLFSCTAFAQGEVVTSAEEEISDSIAATDSLLVDSVTPMTLQERLRQLLDEEMFQTSMAGIEIYDLTADTLVFCHNERQTLRPASTMKLMTAITALDRLGGSYRFSTSLKGRGALIERTDSTGRKYNVFVGDLSIKGGMDPLFAHDDMRAFVESLRRERIDTIYGSIIPDYSFKDADRLGEGWCWDDKNPTLTPLLWNRGEGFISKFAEALKEADIIHMPQYATPRDSVFSELLRNAGQRERTFDTRFHSIDQVLLPMMKKSDNLFAESLFYQISAGDNRRDATAKKSASAMQSLVKGKLSLNPKRYYFADGSGLSLYNYQTAELQVELLRYAYRNSNIYAHLLPSLPVSGTDGTLQKRMTNSSVRGRVKAKTGTLTGVSSLAGYVFTERGTILAFSIINNGIRHTSSGRNFQDRVCAAMVKY